MWRLSSLILGLIAATIVALTVFHDSSPPPASAGLDHTDYKAVCDFVNTFNHGLPDKISASHIHMDMHIENGGVPVFLHSAGSNSSEFEMNFIPLSGDLNLATGATELQGSGTYNHQSLDAFFSGMIGLDGNNPTSVQGLLGMRPHGSTGKPDIVWNVTCTVTMVTPTPVVTPPPEFSITVISLDAGTGAPIPGVTAELYLTQDCSGKAITADTADASGILDFTNIPPAAYHVKQMTPPGYAEADEGACQPVDAAKAIATGTPTPTPRPTPSPAPPGVGGQAAVECPIVPNGMFPSPGCDGFGSGAQVNIEVAGGGSRFLVTLNGPTLIARNTGPADSDSNGRDDVQTELVSMQLTGDSVLGPLTVVQSPTRPSMGHFEEKMNTTSGVMDFPADSFFDIFVEVQTDVMTLHNIDPIPMHCIINEIPPLLCLYQPPLPGPIALYQEDDTLWGYIIHALHVPLPEGEILVVFNNAPLAQRLWGDWDCDGDVDIIDALALERFIAGLPVPPPPIHLPCPTLGAPLPARLVGSAVAAQGLSLIWGDSGCSGTVEVLDSLAIKRFVAGLPVPPPPIIQGCPVLNEPF